MQSDCDMRMRYTYLWVMLQGAEDFRQAKRQKTEDTKPKEAPGKNRRGIAFGTGALEDTDTFGYMDDYTSNDRHNLASFSYEVASDEEDTDLPGRYGSAACTCDPIDGLSGSALHTTRPLYCCPYMQCWPTHCSGMLCVLTKKLTHCKSLQICTWHASVLAFRRAPMWQALMACPMLRVLQDEGFASKWECSGPVPCQCRGPRLDPQFMLPGKAAPLSLQSSEQARQKDMIPGFVKAKEVVTPKVFPAPKIPADYQPIHRPAPQPSSGPFSSPLASFPSDAGRRLNASTLPQCKQSGTRFRQIVEHVSPVHAHALTGKLVVYGCGHQRYNLQTLVCRISAS